MAQLKKGSTLDGKKILTAEDVPITAAGDFVFYNGHRIYTEFDKPAPTDIDTVSAARGGEFKALVHFVKGISIGVGVNAIDYKNGMILKNPTTGLTMDYTGTKNIKYITGSATNAELVLKPTSADFILKGQITANKVMINGGEAYHTKNSTVDKNGFVRASGTKQSVAVGDFGIGSFMPMESNPTVLDFNRKTGFEAYAAASAGSGQPPHHSSGDTALRISTGVDNNTLLYFNQASNKLFYHMRAFGKDKGWTEVLTDKNTTNDKSGFVRASGTKDVVTTDQITNSLTSTSVNEVTSANLVSKKRDLTNNDFDGIASITGTSYSQGLKLYRSDKDKYLHLLNSSSGDGTLALYGYDSKSKNGNTYSYILRFPETTGTVATVDQIDSSSKAYTDYGIRPVGLPLVGTGPLNTIKDSGFKYNNSSANATEINNYPHTNSGVFHKISLTTGDTNALETYHAVNSNRLFMRAKLNDKYVGTGKNGWTELLNTEEHLTQTQGTSKVLIPSQDVLNTVKTQLTTEIGKKITGGSVSQVVGTSTVNVPSLKLFTDQINLRPLTTTMNTELAKKITGGNVVQAIGTSTVDVPSVKLFTDQINLRPLTTVMNTELGKKVDKTIQIIAGNGMTGGGALSANRTITMGTPTNIGTSTTNNVGTTSHTHALSNEVKASLKLADNSVQDHSLTGVGTDFMTTDGVMLVNTTVNPVADSGLPTTTWKNALVIGNSRSKASALLMDDNTDYAWIWNASTKKYNKIMYEDTGFRNFGSLGTQSLNDLGKVTDEGIYYNPANANATTARGYPAALAGTLFVLQAAGMTQIYITYSGSQRIFKRNNYQNKWTAWIEEMDSTWIVDVLGTAKNKVASQFLVNTVNSSLTTEIGKKITGGNVVQVVGTSTVDVPSLKLFTDQINLRPLTTTMNTELGKKANNTVNIVAGNGLSGGGTIAANRTLTLGAGTEISTTSGNTVAATSHTHALSAAVKTSLGKADTALQPARIVQSTGTSTTNFMSQKAVTDELNKARGSGATSLGATDLNTINTEAKAGFYYQATQSNITVARNYHKDMKLGLLTARYSASGITQQWVNFADGQMFTRGRSGTTWSAWKKYVVFKYDVLTNVLTSRQWSKQYHVPSGEVRRVKVSGNFTAPVGSAHIYTGNDAWWYNWAYRPQVTVYLRGTDIYGKSTSSVIARVQERPADWGVIWSPINNNLHATNVRNLDDTKATFSFDTIFKMDTYYSLEIEVAVLNNPSYIGADWQNYLYELVNNITVWEEQ